jgi:hypothetical protein
MRQEGTRPWHVCISQVHFFLMAGGHSQQITNAHPLQIGRRFFGEIVGEEVDDRVIHGQFSFGDGQTYGSRGKALAKRPEDVGLIGRVRVPPGFGHDVAVTHQHETVHRMDVLIGFFQKRQYARRRDALRLGRTARQSRAVLTQGFGTACEST